MVEFAVEPVVDVQTRFSRGLAADDQTAAGAVARSQQVLDIGERKAAMAPQHGIVESFVEVKHPVDALRPLQSHNDLGPHDVRHQGQSQAALLA